MSSYIGIDIGEKRIGVAVCDTTAPFPRPLTTLEATPQLAHEFAHLLHVNAVQAVVIGYPRNQNGDATAQTARVEMIAQMLKIPPAIPIYWQDESLTSVKAEEELNRRKKPYAKGDVDALAATFILEDFIRTQLPAIQYTPAATQPATAHPVRKRKKKSPTKVAANKHTHRGVVKFVSSVVALITLACFAVVGWYFQALSAKTADPHYQVVTVSSGSGTQVIARDLESKGLIKSATAFTLFVRMNNTASLQAGTYRISSNQSVSEIVAIIADGKITTVDVLIAPGLRLDQILDTLQEDGYSEAELQAALTAVRDHSLLKNLPSNTRLEGYLFPDTYKIGPDTSAEALMRLMLDTFQSKLSKEVLAGLQQQGITFEEAVILASIVQKEEPNAATQKTIAQVFLKRLREGMPLGADPTFKYAAAQFGEVNSPDSNSPYNTRKIVGLPPSAIANFNMSALEAVAFPANTTYVYFVHGDDGKAYFSHTLQEHQANTAKFCTIACR